MFWYQDASAVGSTATPSPGAAYATSHVSRRRSSTLDHRPEARS